MPIYPDAVDYSTFPAAGSISFNGQVYVGEGRGQYYPSAVFDAAGDMLPWLGSA